MRSQGILTESLHLECMSDRRSRQAGNSKARAAAVTRETEPACDVALPHSREPGDLLDRLDDLENGYASRASEVHGCARAAGNELAQCGAMLRDQAAQEGLHTSRVAASRGVVWIGAQK